MFLIVSINLAKLILGLSIDPCVTSLYLGSQPSDIWKGVLANKHLQLATPTRSNIQILL
jgi:hypothetical protein